MGILWYGKDMADKKALGPQKIEGLEEMSSDRPIEGGRTVGLKKLIPTAVVFENEGVKFDFVNLQNPPILNIELLTTPMPVMFQVMKADAINPPDLINNFGWPDGFTSDQKNLILKRAREHNEAMIAEYQNEGGDNRYLPKVMLPEKID